MWGVAVAELMNRPLRETLPEVQKQGMQDLLNGVLRSGEPFVGNEFPVVFDRGEESETRYFDFVYQPWRDEGDAMIGVVAISIDVSQRVAARQQAYKLTAMLDNSSDFIGLASPEGQALYVNPAGLALGGLEASHPVSELKITDFFFEEDLAFVQETILPTALEKGRLGGRVSVSSLPNRSGYPRALQLVRRQRSYYERTAGVGYPHH